MNNLSRYAIQLLQVLVKEAKKSDDSFVLSIALPSDIHRGNREAIVDELAHAGYIKDIDIFGKDKLQCTVTAKGIAAIEED